MKSNTAVESSWRVGHELRSRSSHSRVAKKLSATVLLGAEVVGHRPAHHPSTKGVDDDRDVEPAVPAPLLGDVRDPQPVRLGRPEVPLDQIVGAQAHSSAV